MTVEDLIRKLETHKGDKEVLFKFELIPTGNCAHISTVKETTYGFFGKSIPCIMLTNE